MARLPHIDITGYLQTPIDDYPHASAVRNAIYIIEGTLIILFAYLWLEYTQMEGLFKSVYPLIISLIVIVSQYMATDVTGRFLYNHWRPYKINIGKFWLVSFVGVCVGFVMVYFNAQCPGIAVLYPDIFYFFTEHPDPTPSRIAVFYKIILIPWAISTFLLMQIKQKKYLDLKLDKIEQINDALQRKNLERWQVMVSTDHQKNTQVTDKKDSGAFQVPTKDGIQSVAYLDICYIGVQDHYCNLAILRNGVLHWKLVRLSLKEALEKLPADDFAQVHRSYIVNLHHVRQIKKKGQTYQLFFEHTDDSVPASRHRVNAFLPRLNKILV